MESSKAITPVVIIPAVTLLCCVCIIVLGIVTGSIYLFPGSADKNAGQIQEQEDVWNSQGIDSYEIEILFVDSIWHAQTQIVTVENGEIIEASATCIPAPFEGDECEIRDYKAEEFTVPGLFEIARAQAARREGKWTEITYDDAYGFPTKISSNNPEIADDDVVLRVTRFQVREQR